MNYGGDGTAVEAVANTGYHFVNWSDGSTANPRTDTNVTADVAVTANFAINTFTLSYTAGAGGSLTGETTQTVNYGEDGTPVGAVANTGYHFVNWNDGSTVNPRTDTNVTADVTVTANFARNEYTLTVNVDPADSGTVERYPEPPYLYGDSVHLTPYSAAGWRFNYWTGACEGPFICDVTMYADRTVTAHFILEEYTLDVTTIGSGTVAKYPDQPTYHYSDEVMLTATPADGWVVSEWSVEGCTGNSCAVTMYGDQGVTVTFVPYIEYSLNLNQSTGGTITADPAGPTYPRDTMVQVTATPDQGYYFDHWTGDCTGQGNPCTVTMDGPKTVTAYFTEGVILPKDLIVTDGTVLEGFESMSGWTLSGSGSGYSASLDTTNVKEGAASIKLTTPANGSVYIVKPVNWDLSANQGNFRLWVYVSGTSEPTGGSITLSSNADFSNYYITSYGGAFKLRYKPGWNLINLRTSDWKSFGTPNWASIVRIRIRLDSKSVNTYSFDALTSGVVAQPAVIFTFDKGLSSLYSQAFSYMNTRNVRATGYIPTNLIGGAGQATWVQLQEMFAAGWTIGSQTMSNVDLTTLNQVGQEAELNGAWLALNGQGITTGNYVAYPGGKYNAATLLAMASQNMRTGRTLLAFNNLLPLTSPFEVAQRSISKSTTLSTAESWVDTAKSRQETLVITIQGLSASPSTNDWYIARFQSLVAYCIAQGIPVITMDDLYQLQSGSVTIPGAR